MKLELFTKKEQNEIDKSAKVRLAEASIGCILKDLEKETGFTVNGITKMKTFGLIHYRITTIK